ncbi:MAG: acyl-CoA dehydrogenase [Verrucomicrobia bacterium]|nr:acyl-CoA dehydrogenase [Verrucomicrobiota bacterium]
MTNETLTTAIDKIRVFIREEVVPLEADFLHRPFGELLPRLREKRNQVKAMGLWSPHLPKELGGQGFFLPDFARISEALGYSPLGHYLFNCQAPDVGNMEILMAFGTPEQKETWLLPLARGDVRSCFSMTEPEFAGSNPAWMETQARKDGGDYVIDGNKWFTSAADGAAFAIVMAITNPDAESPYARASQIIVPTNTPGFHRVRNTSIMGEAGEDYVSHSEIVYKNCRVPQKNLLGQEGKGFEIAQLRLGPGRIHHCMRWIGICERAFEMMCQYAVTRLLAPGKPLGSRQIVQEWIADSRAEINASRLLVLQAAEKIEHEGSRAAREEISIIKFYVANVLQKVLDRAIQTHGALGLTDNLVLSHWYRHERAARIYDGPDEVHKSVVARIHLKKHGLSVSI